MYIFLAPGRLLPQRARADISRCTSEKSFIDILLGINWIVDGGCIGEWKILLFLHGEVFVFVK